MAKIQNAGTDRELTEQEKREAQLRSDAAAAMDLFGLKIHKINCI